MRGKDCRNVKFVLELTKFLVLLLIFERNIGVGKYPGEVQQGERYVEKHQNKLN